MYYPPNIIGKGAQIDIYLYQSLGYMGLGWSTRSLMSRISDRVFLLLFGKFFLAEVVLHELGHHKYDSILKKQYRTAEEKEDDADKYSLTHYRKAYPFVARYYNIVNGVYRLLFKKRIALGNRLIWERSIYDPKFVFREAITHLKAGSYDKAIEWFDRVILLDPTKHTAYSNRASAKYALGRYEEAIQDMTEAINFSPDYLSEAFYCRGLYYQSAYAWEKAISDYDAALKRGYSDPGIFTDKAYCYMQLHDYERAKLELKEAIRRGVRESEIPEELWATIERGQ